MYQRFPQGALILSSFAPYFHKDGSLFFWNAQVPLQVPEIDNQKDDTIIPFPIIKKKKGKVKIPPLT